MLRRIILPFFIVLLFPLAMPKLLQAQAPSYGCLNLYESGRGLIGRYDLSSGKYTDLYLNPIQEVKGIASPDGKFTAYRTDTNGLTIESLLSKQPYIVALPGMILLNFSPGWSPDSQYFAVHGKTQEYDDSVQLLIASVDKKIVHRFKIDIPPESPFLRMSWSPDSQYIAVQVDERDWQPENAYHFYQAVAINLYGVNGKVLTHVAENANAMVLPRESAIYYPAFDWSHARPSLLYIQSNPAQEAKGIELFDLKAYHFDTQQTELLAKSISALPVYRQDSKYALIQRIVNNKTAIGLVDLNTGQMIELDSGDGIVDLNWVQDTALIVRESYIVWSDVNGVARHEVDIAPAKVEIYSDIYQWSFDGEWLILQSERENTANIAESEIWVVNLKNGKTQTYSDMRISILSERNVFSADSDYAVLFGDEYKIYFLQLADGELTPVVAKTTSWAERLIWAADNKLMAIIYQGGDNLDLVNENGELLRHYDNFPYFQFAPRIEWTDCR